MLGNVNCKNNYKLISGTGVMIKMQIVGVFPLAQWAI